MLILAIDTGGTFTDLSAYDISSGNVVYAKTLTTYDDLADGASECVTKAGVDLARAVAKANLYTLENPNAAAYHFLQLYP